ncbi:MAG: MBL fold metallo-hydrolase [Culicoidibacterales bacterium]
MAKYITLTEPTMGENTYVIINNNKEALIIDPGIALVRLQQCLQDEQATPVAILLTHGHYDHIVNVDTIVNSYGIPAYIHKKDANCFTNPRANLGNFTLTTQPTLFSESEGTLSISTFIVNYWHSPGHSPGSTVFTVDNDKVIIAGDVLFAGSVGRYDFPTSNGGHHQASLQRIFQTFSDDYRVISGHGQATTIAQERQHNPFKAWFE